MPHMYDILCEILRWYAVNVYRDPHDTPHFITKFYVEKWEVRHNFTSAISGMPQIYIGISMILKISHKFQ